MTLGSCLVGEWLKGMHSTLSYEKLTCPRRVFLIKFDWLWASWLGKMDSTLEVV